MVRIVLMFLLNKPYLNRSDFYFGGLTTVIQCRDRYKSKYTGIVEFYYSWYISQLVNYAKI